MVKRKTKLYILIIFNERKKNKVMQKNFFYWKKGRRKTISKFVLFFIKKMVYKMCLLSEKVIPL